MMPPLPTILFGAFDRHNFGDLLFAHIAAALLCDETALFAGLADRDLRGYGGHRVQSLVRLAAQWRGRSVRLIHVSGEILTCDAWQAAIMLQRPDTVQATIARLDADSQARQVWASRQLGLSDLAPYCASRERFPMVQKIIYLGVGGVDLDVCDPALRTEVLTKLCQADWVGVRDGYTLAHLQSAGIAASLIPDPAVMVAELFDQRIRLRGLGGEVAQLRSRFPQEYLAVQLSADFGDDATLAIMSEQLDQVIAETGLGVVLFRAGAAPWHDDLDVYRRLAVRLHSGALAVFESLDVWDICALIAGSRGYCGSSLHGRIVAMAYALPRINLVHSAEIGHQIKQAAFASSWEVAGAPIVVDAPRLASGLRQSLALDVTLLRTHARSLIERFSLGAGPVLLPPDCKR